MNLGLLLMILIRRRIPICRALVVISFLQRITSQNPTLQPFIVDVKILIMIKILLVTLLLGLLFEKWEFWFSIDGYIGMLSILRSVWYFVDKHYVWETRCRKRGFYELIGINLRLLRMLSTSFLKILVARQWQDILVPPILLIYFLCQILGRMFGIFMIFYSFKVCINRSSLSFNLLVL